MKLKSSKRNKMLLTATIALVVAATGGVALLPTPVSAENIQTLDGFVSYDADRITLAEDYSAVVPYTTPLTGGTASTTVTKLGDNEAQLDSGRSGLHLKTVQSGTEAEGAGVSFVNKLDGDFTMDFRVFSERSYYGYVGGSATNNNVSQDYYNTFLDAKEIGITIQSATDENVAFTIYVQGSSFYGVTTPSARVWVKGETITNGGVEGLNGYGLNNGNVSWDYPVNTQLWGNTFVNTEATRYEQSGTAYYARNTYTTLKFDVETMKVYGVKNTATFSANGSSVETEDVLIRDLANYPAIINGSTDNGGGAYDYKKVTRLQDSSAFANGYYVSVAFTDITDNATKLQTLASGSGDDAHRYSVATDVTDDSSNPVTYDRYGNMIIYSLNGQGFAKDSGFTTATVPASQETKWIDGTTVDGIAQYTVKETGLNAEGASMSWKSAKTGTFEEEVLVRTFDGTEISNNRNSVAYAKINGGMGYNGDGAYAAFDTKEVAFDFISATDPTKTFTLYIRAAGGTWGNLITPSARVYIPGDKMLTNDLEYGYGLSTKLSYGTYSASNASGAYSPDLQSKIMGWMGGNSANNAFGIKFDPTEMKVYGVVTSGTYELIRDLSNNSGTNVPTALCASLSSSDFENGYYINFRFTDVKRDGFTADAARIYNNNGTLTTIGGRNDVAGDTTATAMVAFRNTQSTELNVETETTASYDKQTPTAKLATMELGEENELAPVFFGVMSNGATVDGAITYANGSHTGTVAASEGKYLFTPTTAGEYTFTYNVSWNGQTVPFTTKATATDVYSTITFKDGDTTVASARVENGKAITLDTIATDDVIAGLALTGYTFKGWSDGTSVYAKNAEITPTADTTFTVEKEYGDVEGASLTLDGALGLNFYVRLPQAATTETATFTVGGEVAATVNVADMPQTNDLYKFTYATAAKDFRADITLAIVGGASYTYSVEDYLTTVTEDTTGAYTAEHKAIAQATLNYCSLASKYFEGVETDVTVDDVTADDLSAYAHSVSGALPEGVEVLGPRLVLESETQIRFYFTAESDIVCKVDGTEVAEVTKDQGVTVYYVEITDIAAQELDEKFTIQLGDSYTVEYCALSYVRSALLTTDLDESLTELVKALYHYAVAANTYFGA
ncbi:MAG: InlB B-repeat-containing protein [Clostridia bacterium]|nr:InlB B-repeat-containing protein [Clostridia bacterium]